MTRSAICGKLWRFSMVGALERERPNTFLLAGLQAQQPVAPGSFNSPSKVSICAAGH